MVVVQLPFPSSPTPAQVVANHGPTCIIGCPALIITSTSEIAGSLVVLSTSIAFNAATSNARFVVYFRQIIALAVENEIFSIRFFPEGKTVENKKQFRIQDFDTRLKFHKLCNLFVPDTTELQNTAPQILSGESANNIVPVPAPVKRRRVTPEEAELRKRLLETPNVLRLYQRLVQQTPPLMEDEDFWLQPSIVAMMAELNSQHQHAKAVMVAPIVQSVANDARQRALVATSTDEWFQKKSQVSSSSVDVGALCADHISGRRFAS